MSRDNNPWECMLRGGWLFKKNLLCIPSFSMRYKLIQEKHNGGLTRNFGVDKSLG